MKNIKRSAYGCLVAACFCCLFLLAERVSGNPTDPSVAAGDASVSGVGTGHVTITQSTATAIINWNSFNIATGEVTQFIQPSAVAIALNRIGGNSPSVISNGGSLLANGIVLLLNSNGILFESGAQVNVGGLVASNLHMSDTDFLAGQYKLTQLITNGVVQSVGDIRNHGTITAGAHGVYLLSANVAENSGIITSPNGSITLAAGKSVFLSNRPDGRGFLMELQAPAGQALNVGQLKADGGRITIAGLTVNQQGMVQANSVQNINGKIELVAKQDPALPHSSVATVTLGAQSQTIAEGGEISVTGQAIVHDGLVQANRSGTQRGRIAFTAIGGAQVGSGMLVTGAFSKIMADGGDILLSVSTVEHNGTIQANLLETQTGWIDIRARGGVGTLKTGVTGFISANGGDVVLEGKTIEHSGTIQADSVADRIGHVMLMAKDNLTLKSGSQILARGNGSGRSDGGTIIGMATALAGQTTVEPSAALDVSAGSAQDSLIGTIWLGDRRQSLSEIGTGILRGVTQAQLIPIDRTVSSVFNLGGGRDTSLVALNNLIVTGVNDLANFSPGSPNARLRLIAGNDLLFNNSTLQNNWFNLSLVPQRDIFGVAGNNVTFSNSLIVSGDGGNISFTARNGIMSLIDPATGSQSSIRVKGGGNLTLVAQQDIISSLRVAPELSQQVFNGFLDSNVQGIGIDGTMRTDTTGGRSGTGTLTISSREGSFLGGLVLGAPQGPGFMIRNADAHVSTGGTIGSTNLPLDARGLIPDARTLQGLGLSEDPSGYLDIAMTDARVSLKSVGNLYLHNAYDSGLLTTPLSGGAVEPVVDRGRPDIPGLDPFPRDQSFAIGAPPQLIRGFEHNRLSLTSSEGNIILNSRLRTTNDADKLAGWLPAFFDAQAPAGSIQVTGNGINFFNAPSSRINFFAAKNIEGQVIYRSVPPPADAIAWIWVPNGISRSQSNWVAVDVRQPIPPELLRWINVPAPSNAPSRPISTPARMNEFLPTRVPLVQLSQKDPEALALKEDLSALLNNLTTPGLPDPASAPGNIQFTAGEHIQNLQLNLTDSIYLKEVGIKAGGNIRQVALAATASQLGTVTRTVTEQVPLILDPQTGQYRLPTKGELVREENVRVFPVTVAVDVPKPSVVVEAGGDIDLARFPQVNPENAPSPSFSLNFSGDGVASVRAGRNLNLADGGGIRMSPGPTARGDSSRAGLVDISVGKDLLMTDSRIITDGGAGISIHGTDPSYIPGYDNSALHPVEIPETLRGRGNVSAIGGKVDVGGTNKRQEGGESTGLQVRSGGSVGVRAKTPVVTQQNGTPTITIDLEKDPTAIKVYAQGDVNVNTSRIGTFSGGNIQVTSTHGTINAGSGGKNEQQLFQLDVPQFDAAGKPIRNPDGTILTKKQNFLVPGSGIFTYHPQDPQSINFPKFDTPAMTTLKNEIQKQEFLGRDTTALQQKFQMLSKAREPEFDLTFEEFIAHNPDKRDPNTGEVPSNPSERLPLELGDVLLKAGLDIVVPPAGIRGRRVDLDAGRTLDFQGGEVQGKVTFKAGNLTGDVKVSGTFTGNSTGGGAVSIANSGGGGSVGGLSGVTGTVAATSSSTSAAVSSTQKATETGQETASVAAQRAKQTANKSDVQDGGGNKSTKVIRTRHGVQIQVEVKPQIQ